MFADDEDDLPDRDVLGEMISKTIFAVSRDETRPVLNGVLLTQKHHTKDTKCVASSTFAKCLEFKPGHLGKKGPIGFDHMPGMTDVFVKNVVKSVVKIN